MAAVTYLPRALPFLIFRKPIQNSFFRSFLTYLPYTVLAAMVFPEIFFSTQSLTSAIIGAGVALFLAYKNYGLLTVAICSTAVVFITETIIMLW